MNTEKNKHMKMLLIYAICSIIVIITSIIWIAASSHYFIYEYGSFLSTALFIGYRFVFGIQLISSIVILILGIVKSIKCKKNKSPYSGYVLCSILSLFMIPGYLFLYIIQLIFTTGQSV